MHNICDHEGLGYVEFSVSGLFSTNLICLIEHENRTSCPGCLFY